MNAPESRKRTAPPVWVAPHSYIAELREKVSSGGAVDPRAEIDADAVARQVSAGANLIELFIEHAKKAGAKPILVTQAETCAAIMALLRGLGAVRILVEPLTDAAFDEPFADELSRRWIADGGSVSRDLYHDETLFSVDASVTAAISGVAETGSLLLESGPMSRGASLIPPAHICVIGASQLLADLVDLFDALGQRTELPANVNLITGPSKTADIEGVLVTGMHGPGELGIVVILDR